MDLTIAQKSICEVHNKNPSLTHEEIAKYMVEHHGFQLVNHTTVTMILKNSKHWLNSK